MKTKINQANHWNKELVSSSFGQVPNIFKAMFAGSQQECWSTFFFPSKLKTFQGSPESWERRERALLKVIQNLCIAVLSRGPFFPPLAVEGVQRKLIEMLQLGASNYMGREGKRHQGKEICDTIIYIYTHIWLFFQAWCKFVLIFSSEKHNKIKEKTKKHQSSSIFQQNTWGETVGYFIFSQKLDFFFLYIPFFLSLLKTVI